VFRVAELEVDHSVDVCMYHTCSLVGALCIQCSLSRCFALYSRGLMHNDKLIT
jgi:hypothetical protein